MAFTCKSDFNFTFSVGKSGQNQFMEQTTFENVWLKLFKLTNPTSRSVGGISCENVKT